jgi:hypothetical protein
VRFGGLFVVGYHPWTFVSLFVANAGSYLEYQGIKCCVILPFRIPNISLAYLSTFGRQINFLT